MCTNNIPVSPENQITTSDGKIIDISGYSAKELWQLHYEQEKSFANLIRQAEPFSLERAKLMNTGYETIIKIMNVRNAKPEEILQSYDARDCYIILVKRMIEKILKKKGKCLFFEAGVGNGKIMKGVASLPNVSVIGCDIFLERNNIDTHLNVYECTIYEALSKLDDNVIDVFYWNDVLEHIPEDEAEEHINLLSKKIAHGGIIITITPNRLKGPSDITNHFEPRGSVAQGFHFHEYTFHEILEMFKKKKIVSVYSILGNMGKGWFILGPVWMDRIKLFIEKIATKFPYKIKEKILDIMGSDVTIMKK